MADESFLQPDTDTPVPINNPQSDMPGLAGYVKSKFEDAENGRRSHELKWLQSYKNFKGIYDSTTQYRESEKSKVFIKVTKTKVLAAYGQIVDILFSSKKFPMVVEPTPMPEGIEEFAHLKTPLDEQEQQSDPYGFQGDGRNLLPGATEVSQSHKLGTYDEEFPNMLATGPAKLTEPQLKPAQKMALKMEKCIHDQLTDTNAVNVFRKAIFESSLLGTGIVKGPFNFYKRVHNWELNSDTGQKEYTPYEKVMPRIEYVSLWDFHPDPSATSIEDCEYVIQRHRMNRQQLRGLIKRPHFDSMAIEEAIAKGPNYEDKYYEDTIREDDTQPHYHENRYEVLEYWGVIDKKYAREVGMENAESMSEFDQLQVNVWVCGQNILRCVANPFTPARIPFQAFPFEIDPYQIWGVGVAQNMEYSQKLMNGHYRMAIDNLALAGNLVFDVDEASLVPGQNMDIFPGKIFRRQSGVTGTAVNGLKFPNTAPENIQMYQISRQLADEDTGIPSILHGQTGVTGTGRTAAGLSMLMGSAGLAMKTVIKNIDDHLLKPLGESLFQWNMQCNDDLGEIKGDLEINPRGVAAVMQKEVRTQRLTALLQTVSNPMLAPFIKIPNLIKELAIAQDIDPDTLVNDQNEAQIYAEMLKGMMANVQQGAGEDAVATNQQQGMGQPSGVPQQPEGTDNQGSGNGTIGVGATPTAGETGFTGNAPQPQG